jgi:translation initiation factor 2B subunit (eIF-2B alpha/beta/delta family)
MVERIVKQIGEDNKSGAAEILRRASEALSLLSALEQDDVEFARSTVAATCAAIVKAQPFMAPLMNLAGAAVRASQATASATEATQAAARAARAFSDDAEQAARDAVSRAVGLVVEGATIMTHSRSSTVLAVLEKADALGRRFGVIVTESRPMLEGRALAESLARRSISVTLIADAAIAVALEKADCVLIGADKITPENLINKIGTRILALAARERNVPVYAICDSSKFTSYARSIREAYQRSADELWPAAPEAVKIFNTYFEPTPLDYFTAIITEAGCLRPEQARERARAMQIDRALLDALDKKSP